MRVPRLGRGTLLIALFAFAITGHAEKRVDKAIHLHHITAEQLVPLVRPALPPGAEITGRLNQVVIVAPPASLPELETLVADLDTPLHNLAITVSLDARVLRNQDRRPDYFLPHDHVAAEGTREVRVQEGRWAVIRTGRAIPRVKRTTNPDGTVTETVSYERINRGLRIRPELRGPSVLLTVQPFRERKRTDGSSFLAHGQPITLTVPLGEWLALDATSGNPSPAPSAHRPAGSREYEVFIKLQVIP